MPKLVHEVLSNYILIGSVAIGAGAFNVVEGIIYHHILQIHHVKPEVNELFWDLGFIGVGILSMAIGLLLVSLQKTKVVS